MRNLWRKSLELFCKYPILWVPYLGAHLLTSGLYWLRTLANRRILYWCPTLHSVLGSAYQSCGSQTWGLKLTLVRLLRAGFEYTDHCIYTVELVVIAVIVGAVLRGQRPAIETVGEIYRPSLRRILIYSLYIWFLSLVLAALFYAPVYFETFPAHFRARWLTYAVTTGQAMLSLVCYIWIMVPLAIALLRPVDAGAVSAADKRQGRSFMILAGAAAYATQSLLPPLVALVPILSSDTISSITISVLSPIFSFSNLLGDIALVLLASREDWRSAEIKPSQNLQKLLRGFMPLHFGQGGEP